VRERKRERERGKRGRRKEANGGCGEYIESVALSFASLRPHERKERREG